MESFIVSHLTSAQLTSIASMASSAYMLTWRLGRYPFHLCEAEGTMSFEVLSRAVVLVLNLVHQKYRFLHYDEDYLDPQIVQEQRRILFQSLVSCESQKSQSRSVNTTDLDNVLELVKNWNRFRHADLKTGTLGSPLPNASAFVPTYSDDVSGFIPESRMGALVELLLHMELEDLEVSKSIFNHENDWSESAAAILRGIETKHSPTEVRWVDFTALFSGPIVCFPDQLVECN
jgi:hypothetical protein